MNDEILKQMADELAAIRKLLAKVLGEQQQSQELAETKAEIEMVDAMGIDPISYLKDKCRKNRRAASKKKSGSGRARVASGATGKQHKQRETIL
jgi:hypothetical protein